MILMKKGIWRGTSIPTRSMRTSSLQPCLELTDSHRRAIASSYLFTLDQVGTLTPSSYKHVFTRPKLILG